MGTLVVEDIDKFVEASLAAGAFFKVRCMRSLRPFCCGESGSIRSIPIPKRNHQTASLLKLNRAWAEANGTPLSLRMLAAFAYAVEPPRSR